MSRVAWFHCFAGIAGDMALGALLDAGADLDEVRRLVERVPIGGWSLDAEPVLRAGLAATHAVVRARDDGVVRTHAHIVGLLEEARLPERVRDRALAVFAALATVEARLHRRPIAQVHFHEVGGHDAIVDIVGVCAALEVLGVDTVVASPVAVGLGMVRSAHGALPNPAPAVVELLRGVPTVGRDVAVELTTPTGAAILAALSAGYGPQPALTAETTGRGAGTRELDGLPNLTQVVVGVATVGTGDLPAGEPLAQVEANLDDATGEELAAAIAALLEAGAADAWLTPVLMKKGRPGTLVSFLAPSQLVGTLLEVLRRETGTLGARGVVVERWAASRELASVEVDGGTVRVKRAADRIKVEHDDALAIARRTGRPLREVLREAERAGGTLLDPSPGGDSDASSAPAVVAAPWGSRGLVRSRPPAAPPRGGQDQVEPRPPGTPPWDSPA